MTKTPISLQDLSTSLYDKAKAEPNWRFWGLYVHICKRETLQEAYQMAKKNNGAPGIDGVTFEAIEESGVESFLKQIQDELVQQTYRPMPVRKKEIPKDGGTKVRVLGPATERRRITTGLGSVGVAATVAERTFTFLPLLSPPYTQYSLLVRCQALRRHFVEHYPWEEATLTHKDPNRTPDPSPALSICSF
jgi:hypothetical protein